MIHKQLQNPTKFTGTLNFQISLNWRLFSIERINEPKIYETMPNHYELIPNVSVDYAASALILLGKLP